MGKRQYTKVALKKKKKQWYSILAPKEFNELEIGETLASDPQFLLNRRIILSLGFLTGDLKKQSNKVIFKVNEIKNEKAHTQVIGYEIMQSHIRRMVKKEKSKIEDSFKAETKDNVKVIVKPFMLTKVVVKGSILSKLRHRTHEFLINEIKKHDFKDVLNSILYYNLQRELREQLKKVYPCSTVEIRKFYML